MNSLNQMETDEQAASLKEQVESYIFDAIVEFEEVTGLVVSGIEIEHHRPIGFDRKPYIEINLITK